MFGLSVATATLLSLAAAGPADVSVSVDGGTAALADQLALARAKYAALEYDQVIPPAEAVASSAAASVEDRSEAYFLLGSALAITADPVDADKPFRLLLRLQPEFDAPAGTPPKILAVFRKVQVEERALYEQLQSAQRAQLIRGLSLIGEHPVTGKGGEPLRFAYRLRDPTSAVTLFRVPFRRAGDSAYSSLALQRNEEGVWAGQIPGDVTANEAGQTVQFYVETSDGKGPLLVEGSGQAPLEAKLSPGQVRTSEPPPLPRWAIFVPATAAVGTGVAAGGFGLAFQSTQRQYRELADSGEPVDGATLRTLEDRGRAQGSATTAALVGLGVSALATGAVALFVDWQGE